MCDYKCMYCSVIFGDEDDKLKICDFHNPKMEARIKRKRDKEFYKKVRPAKMKDDLRKNEIFKCLGHRKARHMASEIGVSILGSEEYFEYSGEQIKTSTKRYFEKYN